MIGGVDLQDSKTRIPQVGHGPERRLDRAIFVVRRDQCAGRFLVGAFAEQERQFHGFARADVDGGLHRAARIEQSSNASRQMGEFHRERIRQGAVATDKTRTVARH
jgi:hypothetical protein